MRVTALPWEALLLQEVQVLHFWTAARLLQAVTERCWHMDVNNGDLLEGS